MRKLLFLIFVVPVYCFSQSVEEQINTLHNQVVTLDQQKDKLQTAINDLKLQKVRADIVKVGLPELKSGEEVIVHSAMSLVYSEQHEQAKWVAHIITPDIITGNVGRSNNFRVDPLIKTGSASEKDYFLKTKKPKPQKGYTYDGFGYDRGHLAPSADFKWSKKALSESFFYSNMSPQLGDFNRKKWAKLEGLLRGYISNHPKTQLYVVTGPLLNDSLPVVERSVDKVSIPKYYFKVALDLNNKRAIGFIMPNKDIKYPVSSFAVPINEVEEVTGINFFYQLNDSLEEELESQKNYKEWVPEKQKKDVDPLYQPDLPPGVFNTVQAKRHMGSSKKISVAGTVVGSLKSKNGHLFFNLDKSYPNQIFTVAIWKQNLVNFSYDPLTEFEGKQLVVKGKIADFDGIPTIIIEKENAIEVHQNGKMIMVIGGEK